MIAIPVKTKTPDAAVAPLFGKAKWFALVDAKGNVDFWGNSEKNGRSVLDHFKTIGVETVIFQSMGSSPFGMLMDANIICFHAGKGRIVFQDALNALKEGNLNQVTRQNMGDYVETGRHSHTNHHHNHEGRRNHENRHGRRTH